MASTKEQKQEYVTFYLVGLNGEPKNKLTPIRYPHLTWEKGRSKEEDTPDETHNVEFVKGRLTLEVDDWRVQWMRVYNSGGKIIVNGKEFKIKGDQSMFIITEEDPNLKVKIQEKVVTERVEVKVVERSFTNLLTTDQLEQLCTLNGIDISKYDQTSEGYIQALEDNGNIAK